MNTKHVRIVQASIISMVALYATFVFLGNLMDYNSNYEYVRHVLSMDTTFPGNDLTWRAIIDPTLQTIAYWGIILTEGLIAVFAWMSGIKMFRSLHTRPTTFAHTKRFGLIALMLGLLLWFVGFICIGSEWFAMWQSEIWNGKDTAMNIVQILGIFLVIYLLPDGSEKK